MGNASRPEVVPLTSSEQDENIALTETRSYRKLAQDAADAVCNLWDDRLGTFWRSTEHRERDRTRVTSDFFPTVSLRCMLALMRLIAENPSWAVPNAARLITGRCVPKLLVLRDADLCSSLDRTRKTRRPIHNLFTLSLYVQCLAAVCGLQLIPADDRRTARGRLELAVRRLLRHRSLAVDSGTIIPSQQLAETHPFLLFHALRASNVSREFIPPRYRSQGDLLREHIVACSRATAESLLAKYALGTMTPADSVAIAFCGASLAQSGREDTKRHILMALDASFEMQDTSGCWPLGRVVYPDKDILDPRIEISTYEISWVLAETVQTLIGQGGYGEVAEKSREFLRCLVKANQYAQASQVHCVDGNMRIAGWCSDHAFWKAIIESWTSANVLESVLSTYRLAGDARCQQILSGFSTAYPWDPDWPTWRRWCRYKIENEPYTRHQVLKYLDQRLVQPIMKSSSKLPDADAGTVSVLLFGPPGTAKTSIAKAVADGLGWPVITLSPGSFIENGLEYIEASARGVFDQLNQLSRVVVLFDECDELFRLRSAAGASEQLRSIAAFVTPSMLPKLQDLHDNGRVVFFICTNHLEHMDPAVTRSGRIDHIIGIGPPDPAVRKRLISDFLEAGRGQPAFDAMVDQLTGVTDRFVYKELKEACKRALDARPWASSEVVHEVAESISRDLGNSVTISAADMGEFKKLRDKCCGAYNA